MRRAFLAILAVAFSINGHAQSATEQVIYSFCQQEMCDDGAQPPWAMTLLSDGSFYVAAGGFNGSGGSIVILTPTGQSNDYSPNVLKEFCSGSPTACPDGSAPVGPLIEALNGNIYFSNGNGGLTTYNSNGSGILWQYTPPYSSSSDQQQFFLFCSDAGCAAGGNPNSGLTQGTDGALYGATEESGPNNDGYGKLFRVDMSGNVTAFHAFCSANNCADGGDVTAPMLQAADGNFYGTTYSGGENESGVLFEMSPTGNYTVLHTFCSGGTGCPDGANPVGSLVQADNGNIYGVTSEGGNSEAGGIVYYIDTTGAFHNYVDFGCIIGGTACVNGYNPAGGLILGSDGNLYGTTTATSSRFGGPTMGAAFKLPLNDTNAPATNIYYYCSGGLPCLDGYVPSGELIVGADANLYGVLGLGGSSGEGAAYLLTTSSWLQPPVQLSFSSSSVAANSPVTLSWTVPYAYSKTAQLCGAFIQGSPTGAGTWTGQQTGSYANHAYSGSSIITPTAEGTYTYALTCGGKESGFATLTVTAPVKTNTATALSASPNPATPGQTVTLKATVTGSGDTPAGSVSFSFNGSSLGSASLNGSGVASIAASTSGLAPGGYSSVATYAGDSTHNSSVSPTVTVTVKKAGSTTALTASPNPVAVGKSVNLKATVTGSSGTPTGSVNFTFNGKTLGSASLNGSGIAITTAATSGLSPGKYSAVATYAGNSTYSASTAPTVTVMVSAASSTISLSVSPASPSIGQSVTLKATVTGSSGTPTGTVSFSADGVTLGSASLNSGIASFTASTNGIPPATYPVTASYSGNSSYSSSDSSAVDVKLVKGPTVTTLSITPISVKPPADVTLSATVKRTASGASGTPTGNITFTTGTEVLAIVGLNAKGVAALTVPSGGYPAGSYPVKASYSGDAGDIDSTSSVVTVTLK